ncbi:(2,3-dihydroxybenzoyl)adenylate synthase [Phytohabitans rumicis]|uniref:2,3-dihydroxybenzoate-AMP ligase n=1 Tax=Phytohabitans rumicis TaxID=1076125 RepID=A0A6V8KPN7_9ACTN|nr:AMP-binding protein [Phytohabitans rumicis]GFJ87143.1 2,3-dihydroxybenzoate-AMP ligase [Phytohabitans rumicis]
MPPTSPGLSRNGFVPWPADMAARYVAKGYWTDRPLGTRLAAAADATPDAVCLADGDFRLTFRELMARADGTAVRLRALGLRPDDRVVMALPNCWEFVVLTVAFLRLGVIPVMALPAHRRQEIAGVAERTGAVALVVADRTKDFDHQALAHEIAAQSRTVRHVLVAGDAVTGDAIDARALCEPAGDAASARAELDAIAPSGAAIALFLLSGGTTGLPKLIARTHDDFGYMAGRAAEVCGIGPDSAYLAVLPLGHGFPLAGPGVLGTLMAGGRAVIARSPAPDRAFAAIARERVTHTALVPAIVARWLEYRTARPAADLSSLRLVQVAAARLPETAARGIGTILGCALQQGYGMSEGLFCLTRPGDPPDVVLHTQGRPICPDDELLVLGPDGRPVAQGEPGVLLTRGPYTTRGYYRAEELNAHAFAPGGWYRTGDIVRLRPDGNLVVEGREKDVINRGGEKIWAKEVEAGAHRLPGVRAVAAVPMPDPELGERVCLYVVPHEGAAVTLAEVRTAMGTAGIAPFKLPEHLVLVDELPSTAVGKVDKRALRADLDRRLAGPSVAS